MMKVFFSIVTLMLLSNNVISQNEIEIKFNDTNIEIVNNSVSLNNIRKIKITGFDNSKYKKLKIINSPDVTATIDVTINDVTIDDVTVNQNFMEIQEKEVLKLDKWSNETVKLIKNDGSAVDVKINNPYLIPIFWGEDKMKDILSIPKSSTSNGNLENKNLINHLVYDANNKKLTYPGSRKKIKTKVDEFINLKIVNYHPYKDSFSMSYEFKDYNLENKDVFASYFSGAASKTNSSDKEKNTSKEDITTSQSAINIPINNKLSLLKSFSDTIKYIYNNWYAMNDLSIENVENKIPIIQNLILDKLSFLGITSTNPIELKNAGLKIITDNNGIITKLEWELGIEYYSKILNYRILQFDPFQIENADITQITINHYINSKVVNPKGFTMNLFNKGGKKLDFSTGFYVSGLVNYSYLLEPTMVKDTVITNNVININDIQKNKILKDDKVKIDLGIMLLSHFYCRTGARRNFSLTTGVSTNSGTQIKYLIGGSIIFGTEQRMILNGGWMFGKVDRLRSDLKVFDLLPSTTTSVPTSQYWRGNWWAGISYNFGSIK